MIPPSLRVSDGDDDDAALLTNVDMSALSAVAPIVKARMQKAGAALIGYQPVKAYPNCWRMVFAGAKEGSMSIETVDEILDSMMETGRDL